jgi:hypothetical protein
VLLLLLLLLLLFVQCPALNASLLSLLCNIGKSSCSPHHTPDPTLAPHQARTPTATTPAASTGQLLGSTSAAAAGLNSSSSQAPAGAGLGSSAALAAAAAAVVPQCPGRLQLPMLGWGLCSPHESLLQPAWVWLLAPGDDTTQHVCCLLFERVMFACACSYEWLQHRVYFCIASFILFGSIAVGTGPG